MYYWETRIGIDQWDASVNFMIAYRFKFPTALDAIKALRNYGGTADYRLMHVSHGEIVRFKSNYPEYSWAFTFSDGTTGVLF